MGLAKGKTRIIFTLPIKQAQWLENTAQELGISTSKLIRWLIDKNIKNIQQWATPEEQEALLRICKTPWIRMTDEDGEEYIVSR